MADRTPDNNEIGSLRKIIRDHDRRLAALEAALNELLIELDGEKEAA